MRIQTHIVVALLWLLTFAWTVVPANPALAQRGDRGQKNQPEVWHKFNLPPSPVVPPDKALSTFKVAPGFRLELVAAEPLVVDPVQITWDADGRMWAVEMRGYMPNVDGTGEDVRNGRIVVLEDVDGDGKMDKSTVFLDKLQMPRAVAIVDGGVLVAEPPNLWFCVDRDGDLKCDDKTALLTNYARQGPVEHTDNGLLLNLDGWIYNAKSSRRFRFNPGSTGRKPGATHDDPTRPVAKGGARPDAKAGASDAKGGAQATVDEARGFRPVLPTLTVDSTRGRGQWGIARDDYGRLYYNSNSSYLSADVVSADLFERNPNHGASWGVGRGVASNQDVWSIRPNPGINRGYQGHMLREDGRQRRTTATCGPGIYRGGQFPAEYVGDAFVPEPAGNVVAHFRMKVNDNGELRGEHTVYDDPKWEKREFIACTDERFRPVNCVTGPDGCLYIVDMYRGILQHKVYVTTFLRKQILERGLDKPVGLGRIYRVVHEGSPKPAKPLKLSNATSAELVKQLSHANGQVRDTAQRLLIARRDVTSFKPLAGLATSGAPDEFGDAPATDAADTHLARIHALWTLRDTGALDPITVEMALRDTHPRVRMAAIQMCDRVLPLTPIAQERLEAEGGLAASTATLAVAAGRPDKLDDDQKALLNTLLAMTADKDINVVRQLAFTLGDLRAPGVGGATRTLLLQHANDSSVRDAVISGLFGRELETLQRLLADEAWQDNASGRDRVVRALAECVGKERNPQRVARMLDLVAEQTGKQSWRGVNMLDGLLAAANPGRGRKPKPIHYDDQPLAMLKLYDLAKSKSSDAKPIADRVAKLKDVLSWGALAAPPPPPPPPLSAAHQKLFDEGKALYANTCASCHLPSGLGEEGKAPPLLDSPYLLGPPSRLVRIVAQGLTGPVVVHGRTYNLDMPPLKGFTDAQIAAILTYARREWDHAGSPIDPETVSRIRKEIGNRETAWTVKELMLIK